MSCLSPVFPGRRHVVLPVVHVESTFQATRNAALACNGGADGVFLINHMCSVAELLRAHEAVVRECPGFWVGVNCLGLHPSSIFDLLGERVAGVWTDNAAIDERSKAQPEAEAVHAARRQSRWRGLYFGGVAFKYQRDVGDLVLAAKIAKGYMDVVTTSGPGTGAAAAREKIVRMKGALGDVPLAIASGVTPENVLLYLDCADVFLVATGISKSWTEIDAAKLAALLQAVRGNQSESRRVQSICIVCEWNEGRSAHFEISLRHQLRHSGLTWRVSSAGIRQGGGINALRRNYLIGRGMRDSEIASHSSTVFDSRHAGCDIILVAELHMKDWVVKTWPETAGRVMTIRGFAKGLPLLNEDITAEEAKVEDAAGHTEVEKLALYAELEDLVGQVAQRLTSYPNENVG